MGLVIAFAVVLGVLGHARLRRTEAGAVLATYVVAAALVALLLAPFMAFFRRFHSSGDWVGLALLTTSLLTSAGFLVVGLAQRMQAGQLDRAVRDLAKPALRKERAAWIVRFLLQTMPRSATPGTLFVGNVLLAASRLCHFECYSEAEQILRVVPMAWLRGHELGWVTLLLWEARLAMGDRHGARSVLRSVRLEDLPGPDRDDLQRAHALLAALEGDGATALDLLDQTENQASFDTMSLIVTAHARASLGDEDGARDALAKLRQAHGPASLAKVLFPEGPATRLARTLSTGGAPYRS